MWSVGEVKVESDPQDTGMSFESKGGTVEDDLWF